MSAKPRSDEQAAFDLIASALGETVMPYDGEPGLENAPDGRIFNAAGSVTGLIEVTNVLNRHVPNTGPWPVAGLTRKWTITLAAPPTGDARVKERLPGIRDALLLAEEEGLDEVVADGRPTFLHDGIEHFIATFAVASIRAHGGHSPDGGQVVVVFDAVGGEPAQPWKVLCWLDNLLKDDSKVRSKVTKMDLYRQALPTETHHAPSIDTHLVLVLDSSSTDRVPTDVLLAVARTPAESFYGSDPDHPVLDGVWLYALWWGVDSALVWRRDYGWARFKPHPHEPLPLGDAPA